MTFKNVDPVIWEPKKDGDEVTGVLVGIDPDSGKFKSTAYKLNSANGDKHIVFGNKLLDDKMKFAKIGDLLKIIYKGKKTGASKQEYNTYELLIDDGSTSE